MNKYLVWFTLMISLWSSIGAQDIESAEDQKGVLSGQWRTFFMTTQNKGELKDFYTFATGGKLQYVQPLSNHFRVAVAIYTSYNLGIQDLTIPDPLTGRASRYEAAMYDVKNLDDPLILLLGEAYVEIFGKKQDLKIGRMKLNTPLINPTDGWMIPTLEQGFWYEFNPNAKYEFRMGALNATARATDKFYGIGDAIGIFSSGLNPAGAPSNYANNTVSDYVAIFNFDWKPADKVKVETWDYLIDNVSNTLLIKPSVGVGERGTRVSMEWLHQSQVGNGGNQDENLRYYPFRNTNILGAQVEWNASNYKFTLGYDRIFKGGQFLFPREWGRESLFSFQRRERSEGSANNHALVLGHERTFKWKENSIKTVSSIGHQWKPSIADPSENKYSMPDYTHAMIDLFYTSDRMKNLKPEILIVYKFTGKEYVDTPDIIFNKADMYQLNFIINYNF